MLIDGKACLGNLEVIHPWCYIYPRVGKMVSLSMLPASIVVYEIISRFGLCDHPEVGHCFVLGIHMLQTIAARQSMYSGESPSKTSLRTKLEVNVS